MTEDPYVDVSASAAGPLPWWMVPSIYAVIGLFLAAIALCVMMIIRTLVRNRNP